MDSPAACITAPLRVRLPYRAPYAFEALLDFLATRAIPNVERVADGCYERSFGSAAAPGWLRVSKARGHALLLELRCDDARERAHAIERTRHVFDLDGDPEAVRAVFERDALMRKLVRREPGLRVPGAWDGFELAVRAVLGQQVSVAAARTHAARITARLGAQVALPFAPELTRLFPEPTALADFGDSPAGMPGARAHAIATLARAVRDGVLRFDRSQGLDDFVAACCALRGFGDWTAQYIAMRALGHRDAFPAGDLILRRAANPGGDPLSIPALRERSRAWSPYRAYAVLHLWRSS